MVTPTELRAITGLRGKLPNEIQVCAGVWQREAHPDAAAGVYRMWRAPDWDDDEFWSRDDEGSGP
jgi:hypothetical protein